MLKKLSIAVFALLVGALAAEARDVVTLGVYLESDSSVTLAGKLPKGVSAGKSQKTKQGQVSFPFHFNLDQAQSATIKLKVVNGGTVAFSLYAFKKEKGKK